MLQRCVAGRMLWLLVGRKCAVDIVGSISSYSIYQLPLFESELDISQEAEIQTLKVFDIPIHSRVYSLSTCPRMAYPHF